MKVVILAGGRGSRLSEETSARPKPMIEIGGRPILWHIMKIYTAHGLRDFVICLGYKGYLIKEFFANYYLHSSDVIFDLAKNSMQILQNGSEDWRVTLVDTGDATMTGGRLKRVSCHLEGESEFCLTYGDGVADVDITALLHFHRSEKRLMTLTAAQPLGRFGALRLEGTAVTSFQEKPTGDGRWINGGFFVLSPKVLNYIEGDHTVWERDPLERLSREGQVTAYRHSGFWQPMDTMFDKNYLNELWESGRAPWKIW